jgi:1-phosphatidylinositol-4-phosphate 5-kinase
MGTPEPALDIHNVRFTTDLYAPHSSGEHFHHSIDKIHMEREKKSFGDGDIDDGKELATIHLTSDDRSGKGFTTTIDEYSYTDYKMSWMEWFNWQLQSLSDYQMQFEDHRPGLFRQVREIFALSDATYVESFRSTAKEKLSEGGSGAFLFYSSDEKHIVKSISLSERDFLLQSFLSDYIAFMRTNPSSFLPHLYGCHTVRMYGTTISLLAMSNVFGGKSMQPHLCYDIKGSWVNRHGKTIQPGTKVICAYCNRSFTFKLNANRLHDMCTIALGPCIPRRTLKDNDLQQPIRVDHDARQTILRQLRLDCDFLVLHGVTDYSLLIGITNGEYTVNQKSQPQQGGTGDAEASSRFSPKKRHKSVSLQGHAVVANSPQRGFRKSLSTTSQPWGGSAMKHSNSHGSLSSLSASLKEQRLGRPISSDPQTAGVGGNVSERKVFHASSIVGPVTYYIGIVDILEPWSLQKKFEQNWKVHVEGQDPRGISAMPPREYATRFLEKMSDIIQADRDVHAHGKPKASGTFTPPDFTRKVGQKKKRKVGTSFDAQAGVLPL